MPGRGAKHLAGVGRMPAQHLPDADATLDLCEAVKCSRRVRSREVGKANITSSDAGRLVERLQPLNLSERIVGPVPRGFYMHRGDDILVGRVAAVIIDEIVSSDRREIAQAPEWRLQVDEAMDAGPSPNPTDECARR